MRKIVIHNHLPSRDVNAFEHAVPREQEERNRDKLYKDAGIVRVLADSEREHGQDGGPGSGPQPGGSSGSGNAEEAKKLYRKLYSMSPRKMSAMAGEVGVNTAGMSSTQLMRAIIRKKFGEAGLEHAHTGSL